LQGAFADAALLGLGIVKIVLAETCPDKTRTNFLLCRAPVVVVKIVEHWNAMLLAFPRYPALPYFSGYLLFRFSGAAGEH